MLEFTGKDYDTIIGELFVRFPSFQNVGAGAYKPGIGRMMEFDSLLGRPHRNYPTIHVAGTNGKGSVCSMIASVCASAGLRTGLYTSPHIEDFRERMRIIDGRASHGNCEAGGEGCPDSGPASGISAGSDIGVSYISREEVLDFLQRWRADMDRLDLSFFEITTAMAFSWFAERKVDVAVIETGLGGRLDSTNIITPVLSVVTNIGYDHCDMLGHTLGQIAGEKAGIFKRGVPAVVGESDPETDPVFIAKSMEVNAGFKAMETLDMPPMLTFADRTEPLLWARHEEILREMDLQGCYQKKNLRTVLAALDVLAGLKEGREGLLKCADENVIVEGIERTASGTEFHGRWERLCERPCVIADIGHNSHGLRGNFARLEEMMLSGRYDRLQIIYGTMADKDVDEIMRIFPRGAETWLVTASNRRAMPADRVMSRYLAAGLDPGHAHCSSLASAVRTAMEDKDSLIYIGGSAYLVSEAIPLLRPDLFRRI